MNLPDLWKYQEQRYVGGNGVGHSRVPKTSGDGN